MPPDRLSKFFFIVDDKKSIWGRAGVKNCQGSKSEKVEAHSKQHHTGNESLKEIRKSYRVLEGRMAGADSGLVIVLTIVAFLVGH